MVPQVPLVPRVCGLLILNLAKPEQRFASHRLNLKNFQTWTSWPVRALSYKNKTHTQTTTMKPLCTGQRIHLKVNRNTALKDNGNFRERWNRTITLDWASVASITNLCDLRDFQLVKENTEWHWQIKYWLQRIQNSSLDAWVVNGFEALSFFKWKWMWGLPVLY